MKDELRIMIAAGGTGGHVFPAIAIANAIREQRPDARFQFIGTRDRMEWKSVPAAGYDISPIWISGLHRRFTLKNLLFPLKLIVSLWQSRSLVRRFHPHAMICCGGFVSGPAGWMASRMGVPLFLQEQNSFPGVTNRKLAPKADLIFTAFEEAARWLPMERIILAGNPVRQELIRKMQDSAFPGKAREHFGLEKDRPVLLVMGGSGGAKSINDAMQQHLRALLNEGIQIIWQCGEAYLGQISEKLGASGLHDVPGYPGLRLYGFMDDITEAWAAADLIVSRAGAITCSELLATGKAGILAPSPWVAGDHQTHNARALADQGAAVLLRDTDLAKELPAMVRSLIHDPARRQLMQKQALGLAKPDAAAVIAQKILDWLGNRTAKAPGSHPTGSRSAGSHSPGQHRNSGSSSPTVSAAGHISNQHTQQKFQHRKASA